MPWAYLGATQAVKPPLFPPTVMVLIASDMIPARADALLEIGAAAGSGCCRLWRNDSPLLLRPNSKGEAQSYQVQR